MPDSRAALTLDKVKRAFAALTDELKKKRRGVR
jgi:hypothetical protein